MHDQPATALPAGEPGPAALPAEPGNGLPEPASAAPMPGLATEAKDAPADALARQAEDRAAPRTRTIVLLVAAIVAGILAVDVLSALIPGMDGLLAGWPVVLLVLVAGTLFVVVRALRA